MFPTKIRIKINGPINAITYPVVSSVIDVLDEDHQRSKTFVVVDIDQVREVLQNKRNCCFIFVTHVTIDTENLMQQRITVIVYLATQGLCVSITINNVNLNSFTSRCITIATMSKQQLKNITVDIVSASQI